MTSFGLRLGHALILTMRRDAGTLPWQALTYRPSMLMEQVAQSPCLQLYFTWRVQ